MLCCCGGRKKNPESLLILSPIKSKRRGSVTSFLASRLNWWKDLAVELVERLGTGLEDEGKLIDALPRNQG